MKLLRIFQQFGIGSLTLALFAGIIPAQALAATPLSCTFIVVAGGHISVLQSGTLIVSPTDRVAVTWQSTGARSAQVNGSPTKLSGTFMPNASGSTTYLYTFTNGSRSAKCALTLQSMGATIDTSGLTVKSGAFATLSGTAFGANMLDVKVMPMGTSTIVSEDTHVPVNSGLWITKLSTTLPDALYNVVVSSVTSGVSATLGTGVLAVGQPPAVVKVLPIALLSGGTTSAGQTVPISYLQVVNTSSTSVAINGFWVKENGTAPDGAVISLSTVDDKGGSRGVAGGTEGAGLFKNGLAYVPTTAVIAPGAMKLFTIKAQLSASAGAYAGKNLMLDVSGVDAPTATFLASFPIRGTTWAISR